MKLVSVNQMGFFLLIFGGGGGGHVRIECCNGLQDLFATFKMPSPQISN